jgi:hypothetical protein
MNQKANIGTIFTSFLQKTRNQFKNKGFHFTEGFLFFSSLCSLFFFTILSMTLLFFYFQNFHQKIHSLEEKCFFLRDEQKRLDAIHALKNAYLQKLKNTQLSSFKNRIEALSFLEEEKDRVEQRLTYSQNPLLQERLDFLKTNHLFFTSAFLQKRDSVEEIQLQQKYPVEIDQKDLKKVMHLLDSLDEPPSLLPPSVLIKELQLTRKPYSQREVFVLNTQLIYRGFCETP